MHYYYFTPLIFFKEVRNEASTSTAMQYEQEQRKLKELCEKYEEEVRELRSRLNQDGYVCRPLKINLINLHKIKLPLLLCWRLVLTSTCFVSKTTNHFLQCFKCKKYYKKSCVYTQSSRCLLYRIV